MRERTDARCSRLTPQSHNLQLHCLSCECAEPESKYIIKKGSNVTITILSTPKTYLQEKTEEIVLTAIKYETFTASFFPSWS